MLLAHSSKHIRVIQTFPVIVRAGHALYSFIRSTKWHHVVLLNASCVSPVSTTMPTPCMPSQQQCQHSVWVVYNYANTMSA